VAVGVFSAFVVGTLDRGEARAATEIVGGDARVEARSGAQLPEGLSIDEVAGVELTAVAARTDGSLIGSGRISAAVDVVALEVPAWLDVVDGRALDATVPADLAAPPLLDAGTATSPAAAIIGTETARRLGLALGDVAVLTVGGRSISVRVLETRGQFPGLGPVGEAVIVDLAAARLALQDDPLPARLAFVRMTAGAEPGLEAEVGRYGAVVALELRDEVLGNLRASPLVGAIRTGFGAAVLIALLYAVVVVAVATRQAVLARRRELAVLHALGLAPRSVVRLLAVEVGPLVVAALATGLGMGLVIALLVVPSLALGQLVHLAGPALLAGDPAVLLALGVAPAAGAAVAVAIGAHGIGRTDLADATRAVDA
jgi:putative ABC transport system permease protein